LQVCLAKFPQNIVFSGSTFAPECQILDIAPFWMSPFASNIFAFSIYCGHRNAGNKDERRGAMVWEDHMAA
jgi:hypothetical protein